MVHLGVDAVLDLEFDALKLDVQPEFSDAELLRQKYPAKAHARKVAEELKIGAGHGCESGIIYIPGEPTRQYVDSDQGPEFRQRRYFYYITGVEYADCTVTYEVGSDTLTLWIPYIEPRQALYYGNVPDAARMSDMFDVDRVRYSKELPGFVAAKSNPSTTFYVLSRTQVHRVMLMAPAPDKDGDDKRPRVDWARLRPAMDRARVVKDAHEIALIRRANSISSIAHRKVAANLLRLGNEQDVEAIFLATCIGRGAHKQAYHIIAGSGPNAATLHYDANDAPLRASDVLVIDAGCEYRCYASDITRSLPISGSWSRESGAIYAVVQRMQDACIRSVRPGLRYANLHLLAAQIATDALLDLGILRGPKADVHASRVVAAFFPHGLGHHVGLEVHDVTGDDKLLTGLDVYNETYDTSSHAASRRPKLQSMSREGLISLAKDSALHSQAHAGEVRPQLQVLQPGMIVTIEPGLYFNRDYLQGYYLSKPDIARFIDTDVLQRYYPVGGVRIEDDILVTKDGYENLTTAPKGEELLDIINGTYEFL
ncbi:hypothetical protein GMORB2_3112 [Geosmithia morbida]|uniref:Xaa-Pro aminopeptidase n=1 Tax=Geosmithia morbida TaxID=1094350 RepID=A0A9P4YRJ6_9HYPO|nr:uncharacterized protein GMORB2_3112 [Geosmithia morbida]KAF4120311.1 hypothetical protein GMORB2_3112 [Geosmithia morbida]